MTQQTTTANSLPANLASEIHQLREEMSECRPALTAFGNETRLHLILAMLSAAPRADGLRVIEIAQRTNLSRPAVSHHLKILKDAGIVHMRSQGTKTYYTLDADQVMLSELIDMFTHARSILAQFPNHSDQEEES